MSFKTHFETLENIAFLVLWFCPGNVFWKQGGRVTQLLSWREDCGVGWGSRGACKGHEGGNRPWLQSQNVTPQAFLVLDITDSIHHFVQYLLPRKGVLITSYRTAPSISTFPLRLLYFFFLASVSLGYDNMDFFVYYFSSRPQHQNGSHRRERTCPCSLPILGIQNNASHMVMVQ